MTYLPNLNYYLEVARGNVAEAISISVSGRNPDVDTAAEEDIWNIGGTIIYRTVADTISFVSDDAGDAPAGIGAHQINILGLDANYDEISETVVLNGITPVVTVNQYLRIFASSCTVVGSNEVNIGNIIGTWSTIPDPAIAIVAAEGQGNVYGFTVPNGFTAFVVGNIFTLSTASGSGAKEAIIRTNIRLYNPSSNNNYESWLVGNEISLSVTGSSFLDQQIIPPIPAPARTDIRVSAIAIDNNVAIGGRLSILLFNN